MSWGVWSCWASLGVLICSVMAPWAFFCLIDRFKRFYGAALSLSSPSLIRAPQVEDVFQAGDSPSRANTLRPGRLPQVNQTKAPRLGPHRPRARIGPDALLRSVWSGVCEGCGITAGPCACVCGLEDKIGCLPPEKHSHLESLWPRRSQTFHLFFWVWK